MVNYLRNIPDRLWKRLGIWSAAALILVVGIFIAYDMSPRLLTVDSGKSFAPVMIVLGGDPVGRPKRAAELFADGEASKIIVSGDGDWNTAENTLFAMGISPKIITVESQSRTTKENATFSVAILRKLGCTNAIIVTSWYHSRRALNCFRKAAPEIHFYSRPSYYGLDRKQWPYNGIGVHIRMEYIKLLGYWVRYGVSPF